MGNDGARFCCQIILLIGGFGDTVLFGTLMLQLGYACQCTLRRLKQLQMADFAPSLQLKMCAC